MDCTVGERRAVTDPLQHVTPGEPFIPAAATWNAFVDAARTVRDARQIWGVQPLQFACDSQNAWFIITLFGPPTGGTWSLDSWPINGTTASITSLSYSITAASLKTAIEGHGGVGSGNVDVTGGNGNQANFLVKFKSALANKAIETPVVNFSSLTGTGIGGIAYPVQIGR